MSKGDALAAPVASPELPEPATSGGGRLVSLDAYRGVVMFLMMAEVFELARVARGHPRSGLWAFLGDAQTHRAWRGCSVHDLIQPSFSFLVGAALPFSLAARRRRGQSFGGSMVHAGWRAVVLVLLGVALRSIGRPQTYWTFEDTLTQIGLGYLPLFLLGHADRSIRWGAFVALVVGYWLAFVLYPAPGANFDWAGSLVEPGWSEHGTGLAAHWNKNSNLAWRFDQWFLNLFPRESRFQAHRGGYATLSFIPTLATMLLGSLAADELRDGRTPTARFQSLVGVGGVLLALGWFLDWSGACPIVKRIWTPSWTLFSGGWCFVLLAVAHLTLDGPGAIPKRLAYPFVAIGRNSIAAYLMAHLFEHFLESTYKTHLSPNPLERYAADPGLVSALFVMAVYLAILVAMDRRRLYLKV